MAKAFPHLYRVGLTKDPANLCAVSYDGAATIAVGPPEQFGGDPSYWSPEGLFLAAIESCFIATCRAYARALKIQLGNFNLFIEGELDRSAGALAFTRIELGGEIEVDDVAKGQKLVQKAHDNCIITGAIRHDIQLRVELKPIPLAEAD
jgi:organic hydroperoxide reductase OsmC/OhrA